MNKTIRNFVNIIRSGGKVQILATALLFSTAAIVPIAQSCASLSRSQLKSVNEFAAACDSLSAYPSLISSEMAEIRKERGIWYAVTLENPVLRHSELNATYAITKNSASSSAGLDASLKILQKYSRALSSLSHDNRVADPGREFRSAGRALDSLIGSFNSYRITRPLPLGITATAGKIVGYGAELSAHNARTKALREFISEGDTLISVLSDNLAEILSGSEIKALIQNEREGLQSNYLAFLKMTRPYENISEDRRYINLLERAGSLEEIRRSSVSAVKSLRRAHSKMAAEIMRKKSFTEARLQIDEFITEVRSLSKAAGKAIRKINN
ncbi:MAG: hypothetical protein CVT93_08240 [Bacteroidetes bacterium HGW-Bacteroidetes-10]|nr:MAG: hypothetical protein CVT93_08240 [Bacteroidetes bacterium HGW-Bacteroidetes-10]